MTSLQFSQTNAWDNVLVCLHEKINNDCVLHIMKWQRIYYPYEEKVYDYIYLQSNMIHVVRYELTRNMYRMNTFIVTVSATLHHYLTPWSLQWRHNGRDSVPNHQPHDCLLNRLFRRRSKKTSKLRVTGLCAGKSPRTGEFPAQVASYAENVSIWWRHHDDVIKWKHFPR